MYGYPVDLTKLKLGNTVYNHEPKIHIAHIVQNMYKIFGRLATIHDKSKPNSRESRKQEIYIKLKWKVLTRERAFPQTFSHLPTTFHFSLSLHICLQLAQLPGVNGFTFLSEMGFPWLVTSCDEDTPKTNNQILYYIQDQLPYHMLHINTKHVMQ